MQNMQEEAVDDAEWAVSRSRVNRFGKVLSDGIISLQTLEGTLELSMHECSSLFLQELNLVFPDKDLTGLIAMPTMQKSKLDLVGIGEGVELEKDRCLENFMSFAQAFQRTLHLHTYANTDANTDADANADANADAPPPTSPAPAPVFFDFIDPCSGLAMVHTASSKVFSEVDSAAQLLGYSTQNCGCCEYDHVPMLNVPPNPSHTRCLPISLSSIPRLPLPPFSPACFHSLIYSSRVYSSTNPPFSVCVHAPPYMHMMYRQGFAAP